MSDLPPAEMDEVSVEFITPTGDVRRSAAVLADQPLPRTLELRHRGDSLGPHRLTVSGLLGGSPIIVRQVLVTFVAGETLLREVALERSCLGVMCPEDQECRAGVCEDLVMPDAGVPDGGARDAGPDAGPRDDAGRNDAGGNDAGTDAGGDAGETGSVVFEGLVGDSICDDTSSVVTLTSPVPAGDRLIAVVAWRGISSPASASDDGGNTYVTLVPVATMGMHATILSAHVSTALGVGDRITVTHGSATGNVSIARVTGASTTSPLHSSASNTAALRRVSVSVGTTEPTLLYGAISNTFRVSLTVDSPWVPAASLTIPCGGMGGANVRTFYRTAGAGSHELSGMLPSDENWVAQVVALE